MHDQVRLFGRGHTGQQRKWPLRRIVAGLNRATLDAAAGIAQHQNALWRRGGKGHGRDADGRTRGIRRGGRIDQPGRSGGAGQRCRTDQGKTIARLCPHHHGRAMAIHRDIRALRSRGRDPQFGRAAGTHLHPMR